MSKGLGQFVYGVVSWVSNIILYPRLTFKCRLGGLMQQEVVVGRTEAYLRELKYY